MIAFIEKPRFTNARIKTETADANGKVDARTDFAN